MPEPKELANKARTTLAQALSALQAPGAPEDLLDIAEPIAKTMGVLHKIERGDEDLGRCEEALRTVRDVLNALQTTEVDHPAVDGAMEGVAGSLSKMFALTKAMKAKVGRASAPGQRRARVSAPGPSAGSAEQNRARRPTPVAVPSAKRSRPRPETPAQSAEQASAPAHASSPGRARSARASSPGRSSSPGRARSARASSRGRDSRRQAATAQQTPAALQALAKAREAHAREMDARAQRARAKEQATPAIDPSAAPGGVFEVGLASHSPSNFYRGLTGDDVVEHGGVFVATYKLPKMGSRVALRLVFPGDLELNALAEVRWLREAGAGDAHPGFGAKLHPLTADGHKLVTRFVANREPMFYDDEM